MKLSVPVIFFICLRSNIPFVASSFYKVQIIPEENIIRQQTEENTAASLSVGATELQGEKISSQHLYLCWEFWEVWNRNCTFHVKKNSEKSLFASTNCLIRKIQPQAVLAEVVRHAILTSQMTWNNRSQVHTSVYSLAIAWARCGRVFLCFYISIFEHGRWINID